MQRAITTARQVLVQVARVDQPAVTKDPTGLGGEEGMLFHSRDSLPRRVAVGGELEESALGIRVAGQGPVQEHGYLLGGHAPETQARPAG